MKAPPQNNPRPLSRKAEIDEMEETAYRHPRKPNALRHTKSLAVRAGLRQLGMPLVRLAPGKESTEFKIHHDEELLI